MYCSDCYNKPENAHLLKQRSSDIAEDEAQHKQYIEEYGSDDDFEHFFGLNLYPREQQQQLFQMKQTSLFSPFINVPCIP